MLVDSQGGLASYTVPLPTNELAPRRAVPPLSMIKRFVEARTTDLESLSVDICPTKYRDLAVGRMPPLRVRFRRAAIPQLSSSGGSELRLVRVNM